MRDLQTQEVLMDNRLQMSRLILLLLKYSVSAD